MDFIVDSFQNLIDRGGWVMYPLLALAFIAIALSVERSWFFIKINGPGSRKRVRAMGKALRADEWEQARHLAGISRSPYASAVRLILDDRPTESAAVAAVESQRGKLDLFMPILSTIITAAPMLGILGTVLGLIQSFDVFGDAGISQTAATTGEVAVQTSASINGDLTGVSRGIAEALTTTAVGLIVAVVTLLPYNLFKAQIDRTLSRLEALVAGGVRHSDERPKAETEG